MKVIVQSVSAKKDTLTELMAKKAELEAQLRKVNADVADHKKASAGTAITDAAAAFKAAGVAARKVGHDYSLAVKGVKGKVTLSKARGEFPMRVILEVGLANKTIAVPTSLTAAKVPALLERIKKSLKDLEARDKVLVQKSRQRAR